MSGNLKGKVALVTGASRGIGKGIAIALGEAGALVYITGRSVNADDSINSISGSLLETKAAVEKVGGICIAVTVDHSDDRQIQSLFEQIGREQNGQLDLLVNNAYGGVRSLIDAKGKPFWESDLSLWDACNQVGLRSHYVVSHFAALSKSVTTESTIIWDGQKVQVNSRELAIAFSSLLFFLALHIDTDTAPFYVCLS